ncbi:MAG TPA: transglycosylase SLT domain-containing protein [Acidimicrobiales bacterium]|nr:transglycosylase SLT domain-containing protein [Acidimicrobiales bacterium]
MALPARALARGTAVIVALALTGSAAVSYTVRGGDTVTSIAGHFGVAPDSVASANHLGNADVIYAGQRLVVPSPSVQAPGAPAGVMVSPGVLPSLLLAHPSRLALRPVFRRWARAYGVSASLVEALTWMESGWQNKVVSPTGAIGIGQLEPSTVKFVCGTLLHVSLNPHVSADNIRMTARFLRWLLDQTHGDVATAIGGYYQGLASMRARGPLRWTRTYITDIQGLSIAFLPG